MNTLWQMPAVVLALLAWFALPPAGLADIAQREAFRRTVTQKSTATLTNLGLASQVVPASAVSMPPVETTPPPDDPDVKPAEAAAPAKPATAKAEAPREESFWRGKMNELRAALDKDHFTADTLQSRINALKNDAVNIDDPIKQTRARMDLVRTMDELDKTQKQIESDRRAIAALQEDARRQNIPAGWIR